MIVLELFLGAVNFNDDVAGLEHVPSIIDSPAQIIFETTLIFFRGRHFVGLVFAQSWFGRTRKFGVLASRKVGLLVMIAVFRCGLFKTGTSGPLRFGRLKLPAFVFVHLDYLTWNLQITGDQFGLSLQNLDNLSSNVLQTWVFLPSRAALVVLNAPRWISEWNFILNLNVVVEDGTRWVVNLRFGCQFLLRLVSARVSPYVASILGLLFGGCLKVRLQVFAGRPKFVWLFGFEASRSFGEFGSRLVCLLGLIDRSCDCGDHCASRLVPQMGCTLWIWIFIGRILAPILVIINRTARIN